MSFHSFSSGRGTLRYFDVGTGTAVVFQHGLGGDERQVASVFPDFPQVRRITLECGGHGRSDNFPTEGISIENFTNDVLGLIDKLALSKPVVGGISMGAAIAMRLAVRNPHKFSGLILARPAWVAASAPDNMQFYAEVGKLLCQFTSDESRHRFMVSKTASMLKREAPDNLASLLGFFDRPDGLALGHLLTAIAVDGPGVTTDEIRKIDIPTLILGHGHDLAHPIEYTRTLARLIPNAKLVELVPKALDRVAFENGFRTAVSDFLRSLE